MWRATKFGKNSLAIVIMKINLILSAKSFRIGEFFSTTLADAHLVSQPAPDLGRQAVR